MTARAGGLDFTISQRSKGSHMSDSTPGPTAPQAIPPGVRLVGRRFHCHWFLAFVLDPDTGREIRVRVDLTRFHRYSCDQCGRSRSPACIHTFAVERLTRGSALA